MLSDMLGVEDWMHSQGEGDVEGSAKFAYKGLGGRLSGQAWMYMDS